MGASALLLDEHYPAWLAERLVEVGIDAEAVVARDDLRGKADITVLSRARAERRIVLTEDVSTFSIGTVPDHVGVIFCHHARFPRTLSGLERLICSFVCQGGRVKREHLLAGRCSRFGVRGVRRGCRVSVRRVVSLICAGWLPHDTAFDGRRGAGLRSSVAPRGCSQR